MGLNHRNPTLFGERGGSPAFWETFQLPYSLNSSPLFNTIVAMPESGLIENYHPRETRWDVWRPACAKIIDLFWAAVLCLGAELLLCGISLALSRLGLEFLASILGMLCIFVLMELLSLIWGETEPTYHEYIKSRVSHNSWLLLTISPTVAPRNSLVAE
jgi:hypothetical protein